MATWQAAKKAVERRFCDRCSVTEYRTETTAWGEERFVLVEPHEMVCRLVETGEGTELEGLLAYGQKEAILLYPAEEWIGPGSQVKVTKKSGRVAVFYTVGNSVDYQTHREAVLTSRSPF